MTGSGAQRHAVIAGTGRAGTSFLMQFLDACGLDTGLDETSEVTTLDPRARAGLERHLRPEASAPYVIKDPWLFAYCDELDMSRIELDTLIVPMRDLMPAAESRVYQERMALTERTDLRDLGPPQLAGLTPGGVLYSLDVVDQARLLAVAFYNLVWWTVKNEIPLLLLEFPRMVEDRDYLLESLWPWLGNHCPLEVAQRAFASTAEPGAVRVANSSSYRVQGAVLAPGEPDLALLDRRTLIDRISELEESGAAAAGRASDAERALQQLQAQVAELDGVRRELVQAREQLTAVSESRSWRWTRPLRGLTHRVSR
jgi:hypothetical protein